MKLSDLSYDSIDKLMIRIAKTNDITTTLLHNQFKTKHLQTPDDWAKSKRMNEEKKGDHEPEMIRSQLKTAGRASKRIEKHSRKKNNFKAWVQSKITKASDYLDTAADYLDSKDVKEAANP